MVYIGRPSYYPAINMSNPIRYYSHILGPRKRIMRILYDTEGTEYTLLECGHALRGTYRGKKALRVHKRQCLLCNEWNPPTQSSIEKHGFFDAVVIKQALLEGKRRRAVFYYQERGLPVPDKIKEPRFDWAMYEDPSDIVFVEMDGLNSKADKD
jgi:hypothetical protein